MVRHGSMKKSPKHSSTGALESRHCVSCPVVWYEGVVNHLEVLLHGFLPALRGWFRWRFRDDRTTWSLNDWPRWNFKSWELGEFQRSTLPCSQSKCSGSQTSRSSIKHNSHYPILPLAMIRHLFFFCSAVLREGSSPSVTYAIEFAYVHVTASVTLVLLFLHKVSREEWITPHG